MKSYARILLGFTLACASSARGAEGSPDLKPPAEVLDYQSAIFRDVGVVQRKAMDKGGKFLLATQGVFDFSDGPYTNYFLALQPGYAISDFWEVYATFTPVHFATARSIVSKVEALTLEGGQRAQILYDKPVRSWGLEVLWAPLYGKDSLGLRNLVRSDTFLRGGYSSVSYNSGESGHRFYLGFGKTYFLNRWSGLRASVVANEVQTIIDGQKQFTFQVALELGGVFYF